MWDTLELEWNEVNMKSNKVKTKLPISVTIPLKDKFKVRSILKASIAFPYHVKKGITCFPLMLEVANELI